MNEILHPTFFMYQISPTLVSFLPLKTYLFDPPSNIAFAPRSCSCFNMPPMFFFHSLPAMSCSCLLLLYLLFLATCNCKPFFGHTVLNVLGVAPARQLKQPGLRLLRQPQAQLEDFLPYEKRRMFKFSIANPPQRISTQKDLEPNQ